MNTKTTKLKKIAAITMARNDNFFLTRWIKYYGNEIGYENLYIYLDGTDQEIPKNAGAAHITKLPHTDMPRTIGDKYRIGLMNDLSRELLKKYDIVIGCDCDEFLIVDPKTNQTLAEYLSKIKIKNTVSGLGLDIGQNINTEHELDINAPLLEQREYALLSTRYTKPVVKNVPLDWGRGFHSINGHNFHIDKNLYLLHFGGVDLNMIKNKIGDRNPSWEKHLKKRARTIEIITESKNKNKSINTARILQTFLRPIYDMNKPAMLGLKWVAKIPERFKELNI